MTVVILPCAAGAREGRAARVADRPRPDAGRPLPPAARLLPVTETLVLAHLAAAWAWAGVAALVQLVVYPAFAATGQAPPDVWRRAHHSHSRWITVVVGPLWAVQVGTLGLLLLLRPDDVPLVLLLVDALLVGATVVVTAVSSLPAHTRLGRAYDPAALADLRRGHVWRTVAWTGAALCATGVAARAL